MARWPALVLIPALVIAAALAGSADDDAVSDETVPVADAQALGPVMAGDDSLGAFWFCSGGTGTPDGPADHVVIAVNSTAEARTVTLTAYGTRADQGERPVPVTLETSLGPHARMHWRLGDLLAADYVSATVEIDGGGVAVEHTVNGPLGAGAASCSTTASAKWSVPVGGTDTTAASAVRREILVFFNPFPADAVLDVRFSTDTGDRGVPGVFQGFVVPGRGVVAVDLAQADVVLAKEAAAEVIARNGRVVVDRLQAYQSPEIRGLALSAGVPATAGTWVFPAGGVNSARHEALVVANPSDIPAEVDVQIRPEDTSVSAEPFELTVPPHRHVLLDLSNEERMAELLDSNQPYSIVVRTADGTEVAAERLMWVTPGQPSAGVATSTGSAIAGTTLVADMAGALPGSLLTVFNPSSETAAQVTVSILADGEQRAPVGASEIEVPPGARITLPVEDLATGSFSVLLRSSVPVMAERDVLLSAGRYLATAAVDAPSAIVVDLSIFDDQPS